MHPEVEVFSNLVHVSARMWDTFTRPGVRLACSWYSDDPKKHLLITKRNTYARTRANITKAVAHGIPLRAGIIGMLDDQNVQAATAELEALGVAEVGVDHLRQVGRGIRDRDASMAELCGGCGDGVIAVSATGEVWPCVFTRWMPLREAFAARGIADACSPKCMPDRCDPECGPACSPACKPLCGPKGGPCKPRGGCMPNYYG